MYYSSNETNTKPPTFAGDRIITMGVYVRMGRETGQIGTVNIRNGKNPQKDPPSLRDSSTPPSFDTNDDDGDSHRLLV